MDLCNLLNIKQYQLIKFNQILNKGNSKKRKEQLVLSSGSKSIDEILSGGFLSGKKYVIFGPNKTGKTQICHQLCVQAYNKLSKNRDQLVAKDMGFVYYFDTENTFRPERIRDITINFKLNDKDVLKSIYITKIMSNSAFLLALNDLENFLDNSYQKVLIIDSINNHFRSEQGDNKISYKKSKELFLKILEKIDSLTKKYNLITVVTAQVAPNLIKNAIIRFLPVGNHFINFFFSEYIFLNLKEEGLCYAHIVNSNRNPEKKLVYKITSSGIQDHKI
ncbi:MAG: AAA family ATPase [Promethearchaeota archaeon]